MQRRKKADTATREHTKSAKQIQHIIVASNHNYTSGFLICGNAKGDWPSNFAVHSLPQLFSALPDEWNHSQPVSDVFLGFVV